MQKTKFVGLLIFTLVLSTLALSGCQSLPTTQQVITESETNATLRHAYDFRIIETDSIKALSISELATQLTDNDVIFIGEYHGNQASHLLQMQLQAALYDLKPQQVLSMEQFNRDQQTILNRYLDDEIGEKYLINQAPTWPNYAASYRPMIEFAKQHFIPVIAANASADIVRCIGSYGEGYETLLPEDQRQWIAQDPYLNDKNYQQKFYDFMDSMRTLPADRKANSYAAQLARDNTMAESILKALKDYPEHQVIHLNGSFHSESSLGTVALLKQRRADLKIAVITPVRIDIGARINWTDDDLKLGDYLYFVSPQPVDYRTNAHKMQARQAQFANAKEKAKKCYVPAVSN
ncbi:Haem-binding uptake Tiki superfamily ChaN domain-containing protein [uncultured Thiomicrorhabdus sp.]